MAKLEGVIKMSGTIDGLCFYKLNGQYYVRKKSSLSGKRVKTAPEFKRVRENAFEFGWAVKIGKLMRLYWAELKPFMDNTMHTRLHSKLNTIIKQGNGSRGQRELDLYTNRETFIGLDFSRYDTLTSRFYVPIDLQVNTSRNMVSLNLPAFNPLQQIKSPKGATHFRVVLHCMAFSTFIFDVGTEQYVPTDSNSVGLTGLSFSPFIDLDHNTSPLHLQATIGQNEVLSQTACLIVSVGVQYYQNVNGAMYHLDEGNAMRVIAVY